MRFHSIDRSSLPNQQVTFLSDGVPFNEKSLTHRLAFPTRSLPRRRILIMQALNLFLTKHGCSHPSKGKASKIASTYTNNSIVLCNVMAKLRLCGPHPQCQRLVGKGRQRVFPGLACPSACFTSVTRASLPVLGRHFISYAAAPSTVFKPFSQPLSPPTTLLICPKMLGP